MKNDNNSNNLGMNLRKIDSLDLLAEISKAAELVDKVRDKFYRNFRLSRIQFKTLYFLYLVEEDGFTLSDLSEKLNITRPSVTTLIDRMEKAGLVKRSSNEGDRRSIKAVITDKGKEIMDDVLPNNEIFKLSILDFLSEEEKDVLHKLIMKV